LRRATSKHPLFLFQDVLRAEKAGKVDQSAATTTGSVLYGRARPDAD
jgi:hypothetical protein